MNEGIPNIIEDEDNDREKQKMKRGALVMEFIERNESFPFPGIDPIAYLKMKATDEEFPGYTIPIDDLIKRFESEGMKVALGKEPGSNNIYVLPLGSNDIESDGISLNQLQTNKMMDVRLEELISLAKKLKI